MAKPIYTGTYNSHKQGRGKKILLAILLIHVVLIAVFYIHFKSKKTAPSEPVSLPAVEAPQITTARSQSQPVAPQPITPVSVIESTPASRVLIEDACAAIDAGQLKEAQATLEQIVRSNPSAEAIDLLGETNLNILHSSMITPNKSYYSVVAGDSLSKIAKKYNTTVQLLKTMNGMESDMIRIGAKLIVYHGNFIIKVSKTQNTLDLMAGNKLFKRYIVGTGKFGKTPAVTLTIVDKIANPIWTRPSDNKQIKFGDKENLLGTRWMKITSKEHPEITGYGIHGTWERDSIGSQSSAGCIRMLNENVEELFDLVPRKTTVIISE